MKKLLPILCLVSGLLIAPMAIADTVTIRWVSGYYTSPGGEFTLQGNDIVKFQTYYSNNTKNIGDFDPSIQTFCLEHSEYISIGGTYAFTMSDKAVLGSTQTGDPLSRGAAWLYHEFQNGTLTGFNYTAGADRVASAAALQNAIWAFEDEGGSENDFYDAAVAHFGGEATARADNFHDGIREVPVMVLNLWDRNHPGDLNYRAQDQLVCVPEPGILILLGIALSAVGLASRRYKF